MSLPRLADRADGWHSSLNASPGRLPLSDWLARHAKPRVRDACAYALNYHGFDGLLEWMQDGIARPLMRERSGERRE